MLLSTQAIHLEVSYDMQEIIFDALRDVVSCLQFKKTGKTLMEACFCTFFEFCKLYQIVQRVSYVERSQFLPEVSKELKNSIFEIPKISKLENHNCKIINLVIIRKLIEYSFRNVRVIVTFDLAIFGIIHLVRTEKCPQS